MSSSQMFFATRQEAVDYLESCRRSNNYMAENYHDRVAAQHAINYFDNWAPAPLPRPSRVQLDPEKKPPRTRKLSR